MTLGTGVTETWDGDLLGELSTIWNERGYVFDNGPGFMQCDQVADTVGRRCSAAPTCIPFVSVLADPAR